MSRPGRLGALAALYLVQGLPYGLQATALPAMLRAQGVELRHISLLALLALPWTLKLLWAPWVDRARLSPGGRRRVLGSLTFALMVLALLGAALPLATALPALLLVILLMNLVAATQDVAVDGLAVELLQERELGLGNAVQVVGYKVGMLLGGGLLLWATKWTGERGLFLGMAACCLPAFGVALALPEGPAGAAGSARRILVELRAALAAPGMGGLLAFLATYKLGETLIDGMFKPFLVDAGHSLSQIGLWVGSWGMGAGILGSLLGGLLASRLPLKGALGLCLGLRALPLFAAWGLALGPAPAEAVVAVTVAEHLFGGALTTATFAFMMARVDPRLGGTHYTALATVEVLGKAPAGLGAGWLAERLGYADLFLAGAALSVMVMPVWARLPSGPRRRG